MSLVWPRDAGVEPLELLPTTPVEMSLTTPRMTQEKVQLDLVRELEHRVMGEARTETVIGGMACGPSSRRTLK